MWSSRFINIFTDRKITYANPVFLLYAPFSVCPDSNMLILSFFTLSLRCEPALMWSIWLCVRSFHSMCLLLGRWWLRTVVCACAGNWPLVEIYIYILICDHKITACWLGRLTYVLLDLRNTLKAEIDKIIIIYNNMNTRIINWIYDILVVDESMVDVCHT